MKKSEKINVGISIGDPNGIGVEVILKTFSDKLMLELCTPILYGSQKMISYVKNHLEIDTTINGITDESKALDNRINVLEIGGKPFRINFGEATEESGDYAIRSFKKATAALKNKEIDVIVTAPLSKANVQQEDFKFPGHTDYLSQELAGDAMMLLVADSLRVGLLTDHLAVKDVAAAITPELITKKVTTMHAALKRDFKISAPKIAVLGINPHIGDNGVIGDEDDKTVIPTLEKIRQDGLVVYGPYAADSFFGSGNYKNFDGIIAAYHDQGLVAFKTLAFGQGVNFTAGLEGIRTSPDHGTAFEIAGKNKADHSSFRQAVYKAIDIYGARKEYEELTKNTLKVSPKKRKNKGELRA